MTLEYVRLSDTKVIGSDWLTVLLRLRESSFPCLKSFILDYCVGGIKGEILANDYITQKTDKDPIVEAKMREQEEDEEA